MLAERKSPIVDYYELLGVARNASRKEIQSAYRRLARKYHPDVTGGDKAAEEKFKQMNEAHEVLNDRKSRAAYDKWGDQWQYADQLEQMQRRPGGGDVRMDFGGADPLSGADGGFGDVFDRILRGFGSRPGPARGQDLEHAVTVSLAEAYTSTTRTVQLQAMEPCATCGGSGALGSATCHTCQGNGRQPAGRRLEVKIPRGVDTGRRIRLRGKGAPGGRGGPAGDVILTISVADDPRFERRGTALHTDLPVDLATAVLGGEVAVPTVSGQVALRIPEGTQNGRVFRLSGKGMPLLNSDTYGDLFAKLRVVLPEHLSAEQRDLFQRLRALDANGAAEQRTA